MKKQTTLHQIEITAPGHLQIRFALDFEDDAGNIIAHRSETQGGRFHRLAVEVGGDVDAALAAVHAHLADAWGFPPLDAESVNAIHAHAMTAWTPAKKAAWEAAKAKQRAAQEKAA